VRGGRVGGLQKEKVTSIPPSTKEDRESKEQVGEVV
jgi:hypothetical protein